MINIAISLISLLASPNSKKAGPSTRSVSNLMSIKINSIGALLRRYATTKPMPTAKFRAVYSQVAKPTAMASGPPKKAGLFKAKNGPKNMGKVSMTMMTVSHQGI